jgi:hypothetical protein
LRDVPFVEPRKVARRCIIHIKAKRFGMEGD